METKENMIVVQEDMAKVDLVEQLKNPEGSFYCSIKDDGTRKSKIAIYNAINAPDKQLAEFKGKTLEIVNVVAYPVSIADEETGEIIECLRTVLVDKKGVGYAAVSQGITNSLARIFNIIGTPDNGAWEKEPVKMEIKEVATRNGVNKVNVIELV